jgi:predicted hotdog family 3-hydroxylacyl-ACP dehydratase
MFAQKEPLFDSIEDLVPHRAPILLLKEILRWDEISLDASVDVSASWIFADVRGEIPSWIGIEYMAQAISALAGITANLESRPICLGFLLGTRSYAASVTHFKPGQEILVSVQQELRDDADDLVLFNCEIFIDSISIVKAQIKGIQPKDTEVILAHLREAENR